MEQNKEVKAQNYDPTVQLQQTQAKKESYKKALESLTTEEKKLLIEVNAEESFKQSQTPKKNSN
jgi:hypothetical protein